MGLGLEDSTEDFQGVVHLGVVGKASDLLKLVEDDEEAGIGFGSQGLRKLKSPLQ